MWDRISESAVSVHCTAVIKLLGDYGKPLDKKNPVKTRHCLLIVSSLIKPKFTGSSNHPEMDSRHHNMNAMPQGWLG